MTRRVRWRSLALAAVLLGPATASGPPPGSVEFFRGKMAFEAGRWQQAQDAFKAAARAGYTPSTSHYWLAKTYQQMNNAEIAQKHYEAARKRGLRSHDVGFQLARIHFASRKYKEAWAELDALPTAYQRMGEVALMRGTILLDQKLYDDAYAQMRKAVQDFPYKVHSASGHFPELQSLALADMAMGRIQEIESSAEVSSAEDVAKPSEPEEQTPRVGGLTRFGSEAAFRAKERGTETYKMHGYSSKQGWGKNSGGAVIKGSRNWGTASMGASGGS